MSLHISRQIFCFTFFSKPPPFPSIPRNEWGEQLCKRHFSFCCLFLHAVNVWNKRSHCSRSANPSPGQSLITCGGCADDWDTNYLPALSSPHPCSDHISLSRCFQVYFPIRQWHEISDQVRHTVYRIHNLGRGGVGAGARLWLVRRFYFVCVLPIENFY